MPNGDKFDLKKRWDSIVGFFIRRNQNSTKQNFLLLASGNAVTYIIQFIFSPIISRIFGPEAYGEFALYNLIIVNGTMLATLAYPSIYVIIDRKKELFLLAKGVIISSLLVSVLLIIVFPLLPQSRFSVIGVIFVAIAILLGRVNEFIGAWNIREKMFGVNAYSNTLSSLVSRVSLIIIGQFSISGIGFLIAEMIRLATRIMAACKYSFRKEFFLFLFIKNTKKVCRVIQKNANVPKYIFPSTLIIRAVNDLPILVFGIFYNLELVGAFVFANSMLNLPLMITQKSINPVLFQKANEEFTLRKTEFNRFFRKSLIYLVFLSMAISFVIYYLSPKAFQIAFGERWLIAGQIASVLSLKLFTLFIVEPIHSFWRILKVEKRFLIINLVQAVLISVTLATLIYLKVDFMHLIFGLSCVSALSQFGFLADLIFNLTSDKKTKLLFILVVAISVAFTWLVYSNLIA